MNKAFGIVILFTSFVILQRPALAVEVAPHISDREIVEGLVEIRGDIKRLDSRIDGLSSKVDDLRSEMNGKFNDLRSEMNGKFSDLRSEIKGDIKALDKRMDDLRSEIKGDSNALDKRIDDLRSDINGRFDSLHWTLGIFITIALVILGFVLRMQWQMHQRQTRMETVLETQRDELSFIKQLIEKFLPPKGVL